MKSAAKRADVGLHETIPMFSDLPDPKPVPVTGVVKWFNPLWGYGQVQLEDSTFAILQLTSLARLFMHGVAVGAKVVGVLDTHSAKPRLCQIKSIDWSGIRELQYASVPDAKEKQPAPGMQQGTVKWFDTRKGFGFIVLAGDSPGDDVFIHISVCRDSGYPDGLTNGASVQVQFDTKPDGSRAATNIRLP
jgi:CspA family cold shock protein